MVVKKREPLKNELEDPKPSGEDGLYILSVAISAIRSYKSGIPIRLGEIIG